MLEGQADETAGGAVMRKMSFSATAEQVHRREKTVTRRLGWRALKPGDVLQPVLKAQGLEAGEKVTRIGGPIRVVSVRCERLDRMTTDGAYGINEVRREGFGEDPVKSCPDQFVAFFCETYGCVPADEVTRIEFEYL